MLGYPLRIQQHTYIGTYTLHTVPSVEVHTMGSSIHGVHDVVLPTPDHRIRVDTCHHMLALRMCRCSNTTQ